MFYAVSTCFSPYRGISGGAGGGGGVCHLDGRILQRTSRRSILHMGFSLTEGTVTTMG